MQAKKIINTIKSQFIEDISKVDKFQARPYKEEGLEGEEGKGERIQNKTGNEKGFITTDPTDIKKSQWNILITLC